MSVEITNPPTPPSLPYNPQVFFWVIEYTDGSVFCQFDLDDGHENLFKLVDHSRLKSASWWPVSEKLATLVKDQVLNVNPFLPRFRLMLGPSEKLILHRQNHFTYLSSSLEPQSRKTIYFLGKRGFGRTFTMRIDELGNVEAG